MRWCLESGRVLFGPACLSGSSKSAACDPGGGNERPSLRPSARVEEEVRRGL